MSNNSLVNTLITPRSALFVALVFFLITRAYLLWLHHDIRWDEAVYLNMGKYLFSGGTQGFWEVLRPPLWPALLGLFWFLGDAVLLGELTMILFGIIGPFVLYITLKEYVHEWLAVCGALLLAFSDIWFWHANMLLTGLPSATLVIIAFFFHTKKRHAWAGVFAAAAFLTRFPAGLGFAALMVSHLVLLWPVRKTLASNLKQFLPAIKTGLGFGIPVLLWLGINAYAFSRQGIIQGALAPLIEGSGNVFFNNTWLHNTETWYYFVHLATFLPITALGVFGVYHIRKVPPLMPYAFMALFTLIFFTLLPNNQWRFALLMIPGIIVLTVLGATVVSKFHKRALAVAVALMCVNIMVLAVYDQSLISHRGPKPASIETGYYTFLEQYPVEGLILVADPIIAWYSPNKAIPIYYEFLYNYQEVLQEDVGAVFFIPHNMPCHPEDVRCRTQRMIITQHFADNYALVYAIEINGKHYFVFSNEIDLPALDTTQVFDSFTFA